LLLSRRSPLRRLLSRVAEREIPGAFDFLPDLAFSSPDALGGGSVGRLRLSPLGTLRSAETRELAAVTGRALALFAWLGVSDLHWENLALGRDPRGRVIFTPLDVEMILADLAMPTETKLLPDADPEVADVCRHAAGVRRVLPYLGKPVRPAHLVAMADAYRRTLLLLDRNAPAVAEVFAALPRLRDTPIRVLLRGTDAYMRARTEPVWPPLLDAEVEQLVRGDIPYFFRLYGRAGIRYYRDAALSQRGQLAREGDTPRLDALLPLSRGLRAPSRRRLREDGLFALLGAFDHPSFTGRHEVNGLAVTFGARRLVVAFEGGELEVSRDLGAFVGSVYLPCRCGEVRSVLVPPVTSCGW
jgi:hypothetical protein